MLMVNFNKKFSTGILHACFQYTNLDNGTYKSTDINLFHLSPQNNAALVIAACFADTNTHNKDKFQLHESHQQKAKTSIKGIGRVNDIKDFVKVCMSSVPSNVQCLIPMMDIHSYTTLQSKSSSASAAHIFNSGTQRINLSLRICTMFSCKNSSCFCLTCKVFI